MYSFDDCTAILSVFTNYFSYNCTDFLTPAYPLIDAYSETYTTLIFLLIFD